MTALSARGYARHFEACNRHDMGKFAPLFIAGRVYGYVTHALGAALGAGGLFVPEKDGIALAARFDNFEARSEALLQATRQIAAARGADLRDELYAVTEKWGGVPVAQIDRAAVPWFGVRAWGVHVNGYVRRPDGIYLWIGERALDRPAEPGKLDNLVGGGQPFGLTAEENLAKEAHEEAGIGVEVARRAVLARTIDYTLEWKGGLRRDTLFVYDLELPEDFVPRNTDGEVAAFHLMSLPEAAALVRDTDRFKFNVNLVIIDFLLRHGFIAPQDAEYAELTRRLAAQIHGA